MPTRPPYRVIQWATGTIGIRALAAALDHPDLEVVGVRVFSPTKVGSDIGTLAGAEPTGVLATDDVEALMALDADCVLHMPARADVDEVCRMLASGKNVVTTCSELFHPARSLPPAAVERLEAACRAGGTSLHGTGSSPGFVTEALPLVLLSVQRSLRALVIEEFADLSRRPSPELLFDVMGMGRRPKPVATSRGEHVRTSMEPSLRALADTVGLAIERVEAQAEVAAASRPVTITAGDIEEGCVAAQRTTVTAYAGPTTITFRATWYCTDALAPPWTLGPTGWRVTVDGDAPMTLDIPFPIGTEQLAAVTPGYTAHRPVNVVAAVCEAPPGFVTTAQLPPMGSTRLSAWRGLP
ncbi:MAG TPA: dihydrodipicolinate reductase [Acidimicrobiia bacterium]|nr:dihydrodipicolinate reductase [Acidimicrobiia bacterium]